MRTNVVFALFLVLAVVLAEGCQPIPEEGQRVENWIAQIAGDYKGTIWSGKTEFPGTTRFHVDEKGLLHGTYGLIEKETVVPGSLFDFRVVGQRKLECRWEDKNGTGNLSMTFTDDLSRFDGFWDADGKEGKHAWNGAK